MQDYEEVNLGKSYGGDDEVSVEVEVEKKEKKVCYPRLWLSDIDIPSLPSEPVWVKALVKKKSYTVREDEDGEKTKDCELEVMALKVPVESEEVDEMAEKEADFDEKLKKVYMGD